MGGTAQEYVVNEGFFANGAQVVTRQGPRGELKTSGVRGGGKKGDP